MTSIIKKAAEQQTGQIKSELAAPPVGGWPTPNFTGERAEPQIHPDFQHVTLVAGFYGSGKTTFVSQIDSPVNTLMLDFEVKGDMVARKLGIDNYFTPTKDAAERYGLDYKPIQAWDRTKQILQAIPAGRFTTLVLDGLLILQEAILAEVQGNGGQNALKYGANPRQIESVLSGKMGGPWPYVQNILNAAFVLARSRGIQVIGITTEVKNRWESNGQVFNSFEIKGASIVHKMSVLSLILVPGFPENAGAPSALVLKEALGEYKAGEKPRKRVPPKLPVASAAEVYRYLDKPADYLNLKPQEIPSKEEMEPYNKVISKDQLDTIKTLLELARLGTEEEAE